MNKKNIYKLVIVILALAALAAAIHFSLRPEGDDTPDAADSPTVRIGYRGHDMYAPLFVGVEKKYFEDEDLEVELIKFESTNQLMEALLAGRLDASLGGVNTFLLFTLEEKSPGYFKIFSLTSEDRDHPTSYLLVAKDSPVATATDLHDKKIASFLGSTAKALYDGLVKNNSLTGTQLVQMDPKLELPALEAGQVDAAIVLEPLATVGSDKDISRPVVAGLFDRYFMTDVPIAASVVSAQLAKEYPELTARLVRATDRAIDFMNQYPEETKQLIAPYINLEPGVASLLKLAAPQKSTEMDKDRMADLAEVLSSLGETKTTVDSAGLFLDYDQLRRDR